MSPELVNHKVYSKEIDVWSLGVVLYFLAFDKFPYKLERSYNFNFSLILKEIKNNKLSFPETEIYSKLFLKFINKLLEKDIKNRFNIYDALNDPWIKGAELLFKEKPGIHSIQSDSSIAPSLDAFKLKGSGIVYFFLQVPRESLKH